MVNMTYVWKLRIMVNSHLTLIFALSFDVSDLWLSLKIDLVLFSMISLKIDKLLCSMVCNLIFEYILYAATNLMFLDASSECWLFHIKDYDTVGENVKMSFGKKCSKLTIRNHLLSTCAKCSEKLTFRAPHPLTHTPTLEMFVLQKISRAYQMDDLL